MVIMMGIALLLLFGFFNFLVMSVLGFVLMPFFAGFDHFLLL